MKHFKEFSVTKQKIDLDWTMNGLEKPFRKDPIKNIKKQ